MSFLSELKRRNVVRVGVAYAVAGWLLMEVASVMGPALNLPEWSASLVAFLLVLGCPVVLLFSWIFELTPDGLKKTQAAPVSGSVTPTASRKLDIAIVVLLVTAIGLVLFETYLPERGPFAGAEIDPASILPAIEETTTTATSSQRDVLPNSVAVLLCENLSPDPNNAYFAASIHEEILNQLVKIKALNVIARTSVMQYADTRPSIAQIADELNVGAVMECSVRYAGDAIMVTAQLIDPETSAHLWSDTYPGDLSDLGTVFAMQADIAMNIANSLQTQYSLEEQQRIETPPTDSPEAYASYLRAIAYFDGTGSANATWTEWSGHFDRAIEYDPNFALAYARKGAEYAFHAPTDDWQVIARESVEKALSLDPSFGRAHYSLALVHASSERYAEALQSCSVAVALSPTEPGILGGCGRLNRISGAYDEAIRLGERALELDPYAENRYHQLGISYRYARNFSASARNHRRAIELDASYLNAHIGLAQTEASRGNVAEALREVQLVEELLTARAPWRLAQMALVYSQLGRPEDAARMFRGLEELASEGPVADSTWALTHVALGNYDQALQYLERAIRPQQIQNLINLADIKSNYWADPVLDEPSFKALRDRIGT